MLQSKSINHLITIVLIKNLTLIYLLTAVPDISLDNIRTFKSNSHFPSRKELLRKKILITAMFMIAKIEEKELTPSVTEKLNRSWWINVQQLSLSVFKEYEMTRKNNFSKILKLNDLLCQIPNRLWGQVTQRWWRPGCRVAGDFVFLFVLFNLVCIFQTTHTDNLLLLWFFKVRWF